MARIVVAEDDAHIMRVIAMWLARNGHTIFEASHGRAALELLEQHRPDILVTDVNMPVMDGLELLRQTVSRNLRPRGIVLMTNRWDHAEIGGELVGQDVIVIAKPFSPSHLADVVRRLGEAVGPPPVGAAVEGAG